MRRPHSSRHPNESDFAGLEARTQQWLKDEQTVNERLFNDRILKPFDERSNTVRRRYWPEARPVWKQEVVWLPKRLARTYGDLNAEVRKAFGIRLPAHRTPLFFHPQMPGVHRDLGREYGRQPLAGFRASPTSSFRSVVTWRGDGKGNPALLKLSVGAIIALTRRALRENQIARAVLISSLFDTIPSKECERLQFDWFAEPAGMVETRSGHGWLLRRWPRCLASSANARLTPVFSLISRAGNKPPPLVIMIRESRQRPEDFVVERLLQPYVAALAFLLLEEGLQYEGHSQNVLAELNRNGQLTGRLVLRDLADTSVNLSFRVAKNKALPTFARGFLPADTPFPIAANAADIHANAGRWRICRGFDTVERYGLWSFVWAINTSLGRYFSRYDRKAVEQRYLELWQSEVIQHLNLRPLFRKNPPGLATDEAIAYFLRQTDWRALGAVRAKRLPEKAEALMIEKRMRRKQNASYDRLECAWGDLFIADGLPGFFRPAF